MLFVFVGKKESLLDINVVLNLVKCFKVFLFFGVLLFD